MAILERLKNIRKSKFLENMSSGDKIEFEFPFFMLYLKSITSGTISRLIMLQVAAEKEIFKYIAPYLTRILVLMSQWRYPQAKAAEIMSDEAPTKEFSDFLFKLSQSIASGEPINEFVEKYYDSFMAQYSAARMQQINRLKTLSDAYLPMISITLFMTTTMLISSIFYDAKTMLVVAILVVIIVSFILYVISWLIFQSAKPDNLLIQGQKEKPPGRKRAEYASIMAVIVGAGILTIPLENNFMHFILIGIVFFMAGLIGRQYTGKVKAMEQDYPTFFRYMASNLSANIPLLQVMDSAVETDFGSLNDVIKSLKTIALKTKDAHNLLNDLDLKELETHPCGCPLTDKN